MKRKIFIILITLVILITFIFLYARYIGVKGLVVKEYKITNSKIPTNLHGLKVVHLTDIHYGRTINNKELKKVVDKINTIKADLVIISGDLLDRDIELTSDDKKNIIINLKKIKVTINKYAIRGNHDFAHNDWDEIIKKSGFINLDDNYDLIYYNGIEPILINGISSNLHGSLTLNEKLKPMNDFIKDITLPNNNLDIEMPKYKILIMHEPDYIDNFKYSNFDLILAGHSHNGQVKIPGIGAIILPPGAKKYYKEFYKLNNTDLFISSGLGTSNLDVRLFNKPSINLYRLTNK